ncbi:MAG: helicase [Polyangiaceae bacterium]|nr:helicase [Polyangiaceae bacterium]
MTTSNDVRHQLLEALRLDLVGPRTGDATHSAFQEEELPTAPSTWYLTGFLIPKDAPAHEKADSDVDDLDDIAASTGEADDDATPDQGPAQKEYYPSSIGLSVLVTAATQQLTVNVAWADYTRIPAPQSVTLPNAASTAPQTNASPETTKTRRASERPPAPQPRAVWKRTPRSSSCTIPIREGTYQPSGLPQWPDLQLMVSVRTVQKSTEGPTPRRILPEGTRSVSVFLVNRRPPAPDVKRDEAYLFQPELTLTSADPFVPRPDVRGQNSDDRDEELNDLQYRDVVEFAVGHNVAALAEKRGGEPCRQARTEWMPTAQVEKVIPRDLKMDLGMEALGNAATAAAVQLQVRPMLDAYTNWLDEQKQNLPTEAGRKRLALSLIDRARQVHGRIQAGLDALSDPLVFEAFQIANRAIASAIRQRLSQEKPGVHPSAHRPPEWRPFQLAFLLMNLAGAAQPTHADRKVVDLLFFPTGGGKTEAYLGLAAFVMVLRRLRDPSIGSAGVTVLMRYTLRLLTLDQLSRAATLMCALELERSADVRKLGTWPFEIGLWVGQSATPNRMGRKGDKDEHSARARTMAFQQNQARNPSPIPLENCPWCGAKFDKDSFRLLPNTDEPTDLRVACRQRGCEFFGRKRQTGLPILAVDDAIYRRLPAFLIATVDKFANLPWVGDTAALFGRVDRVDNDGFYGANHTSRGKVLPKGRLPPPDLVIQDELHLISGPLGTMVGLYETAIDALSGTDLTGEGPRPKIVASTATVRRAERQIRALFGRAVEIFPPPGPNRRDSFFAQTVSPEERNARTYLGIAAQGRNLKVVLYRACLALMAAAQKAWDEQGGAKNPDNPADPYMTLMGYFNSLRELGGSRRIVEDEVHNRLSDYHLRRARGGGAPNLFAERSRWAEPRELTSRVNTNEVADIKRRLALFYGEDERVDVALATNMISVGLDIQRLGLMVVNGQPKTASEYIQATSRVGRDEKRPGLVITLLNLHRPRDRSHYERFGAWHESFYRAVEATSVTPFSKRAIDRGIAGLTVALARLGHPGMTAPRGALAIGKHRPELEVVADVIAKRAEGHDLQASREQTEELRTEVRQRVMDLLDAWHRIATKKGDLQYQREIGVAPPLLFDPLDPELEKQTREARQFKANRSLRDVEPTVSLWLNTSSLSGEDN